MSKYRIVGIIGVFLFCSSLLSAQIEICDNGIDDDNDGLVDLNDPDCECEVIEPISLIPNPSFEELNCCPLGGSRLNCAVDWIQASDATTDLIHTCGWMGWPESPPPQPFPDGEGILGFRDGKVSLNSSEPQPFWKEYAGACLISPLIKDTSYRFQFDLGFVNPIASPPINISFFGTTDCDNLPFGVGDAEFGCPTNSPNWEKIGEVLVSSESGNSWENAVVEIVPTKDFYAIAIGPECAATPSSVSLYYFFDNLLLTDLLSFNLQIKEINHPCSEDYRLGITDNSEFEYQWYKTGIALVGETASELTRNYGVGEYQVRIFDGISCRVSEPFEYLIPGFSDSVQVSICRGETYALGNTKLSVAGFYVDTLLNSNNCDSIVFLQLSVIGDKLNTVEVSILAGDSYEIDDQIFSEPGEYPMTFESSSGCDSLVLLELSNFEVFIPNAFSPNFDGINDYFQPFSASGRIASVEIEVFDRWGGLRYKGDRWDGSELDPGVYVYRMTIQFDYGAVRKFAGSVTLVR